MSFDSAFYAGQHPGIANPVEHYLMFGWQQGFAPNSANEMLSPDEILQMLGGLGTALTDVVAGFNADQLDYVDQASNFDLGAILGMVDDEMLAGFMAGWGTAEMQFLDGLGNFDLAGVMGGFDPNVLMGLMGEWEEVSNLEYLGNLEGFDFSTLMGGNPDEMMGLMERLGSGLQNTIYDDFDAEDFAWLDGAADFDLAGMMGSNFDFFRQMMSPEEALGLFGSLGGNVTNVVQGLDAADLAFLDGAPSFDLGGFLGGLDDSLLGGFMEGWDSDELQFLDGLPSFDLGGVLAGFDPEAMGEMLGGWDDPSALNFLNGLEGFDLAGMLDGMPSDMVGGLLGEWDDSMLSALNGLGGDFDPNEWIAGAGDFLPSGFDWEGYVPPIEGGGTLPGGLPSGLPSGFPGGMPSGMIMPPMTFSMFGTIDTDYSTLALM